MNEKSSVPPVKAIFAIQKILKPSTSNTDSFAGLAGKN
jgi:hypothetical protein